jgi:hypothetical protein
MLIALWLCAGSKLVSAAPVQVPNGNPSLSHAMKRKLNHVAVVGGSHNSARRLGEQGQNPSLAAESAVDDPEAHIRDKRRSSDRPDPNSLATK